MSDSKPSLILVGSRLRVYREYAMASLASRYAITLVSSQPVTWEQPYLAASRTADTTDAAALLAVVTDLVADLGPEVGIFTWDELSLTATAEVAEQVGLPHLSLAAAQVCRDKYATRAALDRAGLPAVRHRLVGSVSEAVEAASEIGYPVVLKPRSLAGSLGVSVARDEESLRAAYETAVGAGLSGLRTEVGVLVEEYLDGPEISVDSCVVDGVAEIVFVARKRLGFDPFCEEVGHLVGPWRHEPWAAEVADLVRAAHTAVGVDRGVTHTEIRLTAAGPRLIELNGRLGGDLIPHVGLLATGVDLVAAGAAVAFGETPDLTPTLSRSAEIRFLYPLRDAVVESIDTEAAEAVPGVVEIIRFAEPGTELLLPPQSLTPRTVGVIAVGENDRACRITLDRAEDEVRVVLRGAATEGLGALAENAVTRRFLSADRGVERMVVHGVRGVDWFRFGAGGGEALNRPVFLSSTERGRLEADLNGIFDLMTTLPDRLFDGDRRAFAKAVGMSAIQTDLVLRGAGERVAPMSRADMYREPDGFKLMELNTGSSLGGWQMTEFTQAMMYDREFLKFLDEENLTSALPLAAIAKVLRAETADRDMPSRPVLAITDWPTDYAKGKAWLDFVVPAWMRLGFDPVVCHIGELTYPDGVPHVHGKKIDIIYRIFLPGEITDEQSSYDLVDPLLAAVEKGHTYLFAGLDCELYGNKGSLAIISDQGNAHVFDEREHDLIDRVLPWTRFLREGKAPLHGEPIDLVPYVLSNKDSLALKPTILYGGVGVITGWTVTQGEWERHIADAIGGPYVVQQRVLPLAERFVSDTGPGFQEMVVAYGVMMVDSKYAGMLVRGIPDAGAGIVSMSNGAQIGCAFHVEDRP